MCLICETQKAERVTPCWFITSSMVKKLAWDVWDLVSLTEVVLPHKGRFYSVFAIKDLSPSW